MTSGSYVALLRGINVGGKNIVRMADCGPRCEDAGHAAVSTYIQSGNVLFESDGPLAALERDSRQCSKAPSAVLVVVVRCTGNRNRRHPGTGRVRRCADIHHSDVIFLKAPLTSRQALRAVELRDGVDHAWPGTGVLYFSRLSERLSQSRMSRMPSTPQYQNMTIRNWRTTTRLLSLLDERSAARGA